MHCDCVNQSYERRTDHPKVPRLQNRPRCAWLLVCSLEEGETTTSPCFSKPSLLDAICFVRKLFKTAEIKSLSLWKVADLITLSYSFCSHKFRALPHASHIFPDFLAIPCAELLNAHSAFDPGAIASAAVYGALLGASVEESLRCRLECGHQAVVLS